MFSSYRFLISGVARSGKSTFSRSTVRYFNSLGIRTKEYSFASELKKECDLFTLLNFGISAFTENDAEKKIIRPLLLCVGTQIWRNLDVDHWIKKVDAAIEDFPYPHIAVLGDGRFSNEIEWAQKNGIAIHLSRTNGGILVPPNNKDEEENDPICSSLANHQFSWETFGDNFEEMSYYSVSEYLKKIFPPEQISKWQNDFPIQTRI